MERATFLVEEMGLRVTCLLNPESLVVRRVAGVQPRRSVGGQLTGEGLADDPLLYTGGGRTEVDLDLLFDIALAGSTVTTDDVRDLTHPLWLLSENLPDQASYGRLPLVRFVWGKAWNISGVVSAVAERLEQFTPSGIPQRSWLRMRLLRVAEPSVRTTPAQGTRTASLSPGMLAPPDERDRVHQVMGSGDPGGGGERLEQIAARYYGNPGLWRAIAWANNLDDPGRVPPGSLLRIPRMPNEGAAP